MFNDSNNFKINNITFLNEYCGKDEEVVIPEGVTVIGKKAFEKNESIKSIILPNTVVGIDTYAFV